MRKFLKMPRNNLIRYLVRRWFLILIALEFTNLMLAIDFCSSYPHTSAHDSRDRSGDGCAATACSPTSHYVSSSYIYFSWSVECQRKGKGHFKGYCCITPKNTLEKFLSFEKIQPGVMAMLLFLLPSILFC